MTIPNRSLIISNYTKLSYTMMSLLFRRKRLVFSDNNFQKFPKIDFVELKVGSNNNYWIKLSSIIGNYRPRKTSRLRRKEETSLYKIILCGCLIIQICFTTEPRSGLMTDSG